jgi:transglutaminase-like putative cysteine protease
MGGRYAKMTFLFRIALAATILIFGSAGGFVRAGDNAAPTSAPATSPDSVPSTDSAGPPQARSAQTPALSVRAAARQANRLAKSARTHFDALARTSPPKFVLGTEPAKNVEGTLTQKITVPNATVDEWVLAAAEPTDLPGQRHVEWSMDPSARSVRERGNAERPLLLARVPLKGTDDDRHEITIHVTYRTELMSRDLKPLDPEAKEMTVGPPGRAERAAALAASDTIDFKTPDFQAWLDREKLRPNPDETEMDFAARAFRWVRDSCKYEYTAAMDRSASHVCSSRTSDCGGLSALFVSTLRANGIPARRLVGRWASSAKPGAKVGDVDYYQQHVKAEFFAAGIGWVPADPASAVLWDKSADGLQYFGHDPGDFIAFHLDGDFLIDTIYFGKQTVQYLQGAAFWVKGTGTVEGYSVETQWDVKGR